MQNGHEMLGSLKNTMGDIYINNPFFLLLYYVFRYVVNIVQDLLLLFQSAKYDMATELLKRCLQHNKVSQG